MLPPSLEAPASAGATTRQDGKAGGPLPHSGEGEHVRVLVGVEHYFRRLTLLAARSVRICEMAISFSLRRPSGWGSACRIRTELRLSRLVKTTSCSSDAWSRMLPSASGWASRHSLAVCPKRREALSPLFHCRQPRPNGPKIDLAHAVGTVSLTLTGKQELVFAVETG